MIVQKQDLIDQIKEAKRRGKLVAVGGPYPTSVPDEAISAGADYMILDEGEITLPMFVEAVQRGEKVEFSAQLKNRCHNNSDTPL
jgi:radical SAM superfamily enzyme YgiQ (UPF0313 family)